MFDLDSAVGIEIRGDDLVFASVSKGFQEYSLKSCGVLENFRDLESPELYEWIQRYQESKGFNRENVILGLPRDRVIIREVELPLEVEENLEQVVRLQVERFEPLEEERSYYDHIVLERDEEEKKILLQILMVPQVVLEEYLTLFKEVDIYPAAVRVSSVGWHQIFSAHADGHSARGGRLIVAINPGEIEFILTGPDKLLSQRVRVDEGDLSFDHLLIQLDRFISQLDGVEEGLEKIYLAGLLADNFAEDFQERFQHCEFLLEGINLKESNGDIGTFTTAVGLAISGTTKSAYSRSNLIPAERRLIAERPSFLPTLVLAGLLVILGLAALGRGYFQNQNLLKSMKTQTEFLSTDFQQAMYLREAIQERQAQLSELQSLMTGRQRVLLVLQELTERIPETSFLQNLSVRGDRVSITGFSDSASTLLKDLLDSRQLESVESRYIVPDRTRTNRERFSFEANIKEPR